MFSKSLGVLAVLLAAVAAEYVNYSGHRVYRLRPETEEQVQVLNKLANEDADYIYWSDVATAGHAFDIMVGPEKTQEFFGLVNATHMSYDLFMDDVQRFIDNERPKVRSSKFDWTDYGTLEDVYDWLEEIAAKHEEVELVEGGTSYERRKILGVKVSYSPNNANRAVFLEGGIHAREWISSAVVTFMLNQILTSTDPAVRQMAESYDWYVFPNTNPDGYVYTFTNNRMWRKTRQPYGFCYGADPNRNWDSAWNTVGASSNPCMDTYAGSSAFSEIETKSLSDYIATIGDKLVAYIGHHSYSQYLLLPYGHTAEKLDNYYELMDVAKVTLESLSQRYGTRYVAGNIVDLLYPAAGGSMDWVKKEFKTRITYTYELRDTGRYGFLLPADQIIPSGWETLDALVTMLSEFEKRP